MSPVGDLAHHREERPPLLCECILDPDRRLGVDVPSDYSSAFEVAEPLGQQARANSGDLLQQRSESRRFCPEDMDKQSGPLFAEQFKCRLDRRTDINVVLACGGILDFHARIILILLPIVKYIVTI